MTAYYKLELENDRLLNVKPFIKFCLDNQGKDIALKVLNEGHCLAFCGVYDILDMFTFKSVTLHTWNILEYHDKYQIDTSNWTHWLSSIKNFDFKFDYTWNKEKIFGCFFGRPSAPRLGMAGYLAKFYNDKSFLQLKFNFSEEDTRKLFDLERLFSWHPESIELFANLKHNYNQYQNSNIEYVESNYDYGRGQLNYAYKNILVDMVSEPTCKGTSFYPTEKIVRSMLCRRPFIVMGSKNYLIYLRQMGFKTFNQHWDEDYDGHDGKEKYHQILKLIDVIASKSTSELENMYNEMKPILDHNYNLLVDQKYCTKINYVK
jgi:hypothetical protein